jgi:hypothetical protein
MNNPETKQAAERLRAFADDMLPSSVAADAYTIIDALAAAEQEIERIKQATAAPDTRAPLSSAPKPLLLASSSPMRSEWGRRMP